LLAPALATATYNMATASPCPFRFQVATEAGLDVGGSVAGLIAAVLSACGVSLATLLLPALPGIGRCSAAS
jgi:DHA1 family inner membrane transport protein